MISEAGHHVDHKGNVVRVSDLLFSLGQVHYHPTPLWTFEALSVGPLFGSLLLARLSSAARFSNFFRASLEGDRNYRGHMASPPDFLGSVSGEGRR